MKATKSILVHAALGRHDQEVARCTRAAELAAEELSMAEAERHEELVRLVNKAKELRVLRELSPHFEPEDLCEGLKPCFGGSPSGRCVYEAEKPEVCLFCDEGRHVPRKA